MRAKNFGKKSSDKVRKNVFYIHTNIVTKKCGKKYVRNNYSRITRRVRAKNVRKKSSGKSAKKRFLYSHEYRDPKGGKKRAKLFFQKHTNSACKKCSEKIVQIMGKNVFYIHTDIVTKKWGEKTHETICPETHE